MKLTVSLTKDQWDIVMGCVGACAPSGGGSVYKHTAELISAQLGMPIKESKVIWATSAVINEAVQAEAVNWVGNSEHQMGAAYQDALIEEAA